MSTDFWVDALSVGVDEFDRAHRQQLNAIGEIESALADGRREEAVALLDHLLLLLAHHQAEELDLLVRASYPGIDHIREVQSANLERLCGLKDQVERGEGPLSEAKRVATEMRMAFVDYLLKGDINFKSHLEMTGYGYR
jgi:hemerythrin